MNNPAKFHKNPIDSLGGVADKGPYIYVYERNGLGGKFPPKF